MGEDKEGMTAESHPSFAWLAKQACVND